jgi:hypothetical protein
MDNKITAFAPLISTLEKLPPDTLRITCSTMDYRNVAETDPNSATKQEFDFHMYSLLIRRHDSMIAALRKEPPDFAASEKASEEFVTSAKACLRLPGSRSFALPQASIDYHLDLKTRLHALARTNPALLRSILQQQFADNYDPRLESFTNMAQEFESMQQSLGPEDSWQMTRATRHLFSTTVDKAFFATTRGEFGTATENVRKGDQVWVLAGGKVPYILRPVSGDEYEFIGEAYVMGIMYGEAVKERGEEVRGIFLR